MSSAFEGSSARRSRRTARHAAGIAKQKEKAALVEAESDIATKKAKALSGKAGRRSLIKSSPSGLATNLGGTAG